MQCITNTFCNLAVNAVHEMPEKGGAAELEGALPGCALLGDRELSIWLALTSQLE